MSTTDLPEDLPEEPERPRSTDQPTTPPAKPRARVRKGGGPFQFVRDVQLEMKKVSWPSRSEVASTTVVVIIAVVFFSLYLWGVDSLLSLLFSKVDGWLR